VIQLPRRLPAAFIAASLAVAALLSLWAPAAGARRAASCATRSHRRAHARSCTRQRRHGARRGALRSRHAATTHAAAPATLTRALPVCEDGHAAVRNGEGALVCSDDSVPACREGASSTESPQGDVLYCTTTPPAAQGEDCSGEGCEQDESGEGSSGSPCRNGGSATLEEGAFACPDGEEPSCPEGTDTTLTPDETELFCEPVVHRS
jgi:hypothetical protein